VWIWCWENVHLLWFWFYWVSQALTRLFVFEKNFHKYVNNNQWINQSTVWNRTWRLPLLMNWGQFWASFICFQFSLAVFLWTALGLSSHLILILVIDCFPGGFPTKIVHAFL
jgi:hypothetical protein